MKHATPTYPPEASNSRLSQIIGNSNSVPPANVTLESGNFWLSDVNNFTVLTGRCVTLLPETGYVRLPAVLAVIPVSKSTWWNGIKAGRFPKPTKKFGPGISAWDVRDIRALIQSVA